MNTQSLLSYIARAEAEHTRHQRHDDLFHRVLVMAGKRAERNGRDAGACGRKAVALCKAVRELGLPVNIETILSTTCGEY